MNDPADVEGQPRSEKQEKKISRLRIRSLAQRPRCNGFARELLQLLRESWLDWASLVGLGGLTAGLWTLHSTRVRYFPVTFSDSGDIVYPELAYPDVPPIFSSAAAGVMAAVIPIAAILLCQLRPRTRSLADAYNGILGLTYSLVTGTFFQVVIKKSIGGFRPHFLSVCQPDLSAATGDGFHAVMFRSDSCTGDAKEIQNAMESFPSGHSTIAFAGFLYLSVYLNAHLAVVSISAPTTPRRPHHWQMLCVVAPLLLATYLAATLVLGHHHHGYDVLFGSFIGASMSLWSYKMVFASIWHRPTNCQPLRRRPVDQADESVRDSADPSPHPVLPTTQPSLTASPP